ncbi:thiamine diphosphokinase [Helicobacter mustelae]|uniref:Thiamine diphosphokinase n=1 Tax=Helicobacter mustelae (strain ATCC 43772 / CCUG 25715 / CIP 103759 / LMG 18044 / NCTC 12198 / R85-136P) TaxID=679897 RepID=D3UJ28_HELM1|nr:thiamine diphosphokinase [Helicobacter mustelae]CBG40503.1 putative thiamin pyrophosphokinase protein [Helicobacter mustelae 12198]SQH72002.1 thiamin pyrophosphokinase [Helicobacter mustelae]
MKNHPNKKAFILANGSFPKNKALRTLLHDAEFLVVCDGAMRHLEALDILPHAIIGDLDSISPQLKAKYQDRIIEIKEQNSNDLSKAFFYCISLGYKEITILGATGKREDHTLANISLLLHYHSFAKVILRSDYGTFQTFAIKQSPHVIQSFKGQQISLFCLDPSVQLTSTKLKYPLNDLSLPLWANGTLNEALGTDFTLSSNKPTLVLVYQTL